MMSQKNRIVKHLSDRLVKEVCMSIIEVSKLTKVYKKSVSIPGLYNTGYFNVKNDVTAVNQIDFNVAEGEFFGLLGPNGAGKTTTVLMLSTLATISAGTASICGFDVGRKSHNVRANIGYVSQESIIDESLTAYENLEMAGVFYNMKRKELHSSINTLLELTELYERKKDLVKTFSGGMKRKLEIIGAIIHKPRVLFIDEPTIGLDPHVRKVIWNYLKELVKEYKITIFLTTHYLDEADALCDRIAIIDKGEIKKIGAPSDLKNEIGKGGIVLKLESKDVKLDRINSLDFVSRVELKESTLKVFTDNPEENIASILSILNSQGAKVSRVSMSKPDLNDVFFVNTGHNIQEPESK